MARTVINNRYSQTVNYSVTEVFTGTSLGSGTALRDPRTGIAAFQWICSGLTVEDMHFVYEEKFKMYLSIISFTLDGLSASVERADSGIFTPKVTLRNSNFLIFGGTLLNRYLQIYILSSAGLPSAPMYSVFVEAVFN